MDKNRQTEIQVDTQKGRRQEIWRQTGRQTKTKHLNTCLLDEQKVLIHEQVD